MFDIFDRILSTLIAIGQLVAWALASVVNLVIAALGAFIGAVLGLLSFMPDPPDEPAAQWIGWLNWIFPLGAILAIATVFLGLYVAMLVIRIALRWVKAL